MGSNSKLGKGSQGGILLNRLVNKMGKTRIRCCFKAESSIFTNIPTQVSVKTMGLF